MQPANLIRKIGLAIVLSFAPTLWAAEARVAVTRDAQAVHLKIVPPAGAHLNFDGPWKLDVAGPLQFEGEKHSFGLEQMDKQAGQFNLKLSAAAATDSHGEYNLTYFFCADDNSWCKRAQTKGTL